ncbi:MAG: VCBS repeat-containing protein [Deltaproteobacteria bacterium]|nr:VCBS repeat-containing protein [Deltaproteobacteria bacterium]
MAPRAVSHIEVSGGSGHYTAQLLIETGNSGDPVVDATPTDPADGGPLFFTYKAGGVGGVVDKVQVSDGSTTAVVQIRVGQSLAITPEQLNRAPLQSWAFNVSGGQAPFCFSVATEESHGGACDGAALGLGCTSDGGAACVISDGGTGSCIVAAPPDDAGNSNSASYQARSCGDGFDVITVTDATGSSATARVGVSAELMLLTGSSSTNPRGTVLLQASGGVPPYLFSLDDRGNRSGGSVDTGGVYTAGPNANVSDVVQVVDAVGARTVAGIDVGDNEVQVPRSAGVIVVSGDFNGDGLSDVAAVVNTLLGTQLLLAAGDGTGLSPVRTFFLSQDFPDQVLVGDFDGSGTADLLLVTSINTGYELRFVSGRRDGSFDFPVPIAARFDQIREPLVVMHAHNGLQLVQDMVLTMEPGDGGNDPRSGVAVDLDPHTLGINYVSRFDLPFSGTWDAEQILAADFEGNDTQVVVVHGGAPSTGASACPGGAAQAAWFLTFQVDDDGGIEQTTYADAGALCVPVSDPEFDTLTPLFHDPNQALPDFLVTHSDDTAGSNSFSYAVQEYSDQTGQYHAVNIPEEAPDHAVGYYGNWIDDANGYPAGIHAEVITLGETGNHRYMLPVDGGQAVLRSDALPPLASAVFAVDVDNDAYPDAVILEGDAGLVRVQRGGPDARLGLGHTRQLVANAQLAVATDLDGDGRADLVVADDALRIWWGSADGGMAQDRAAPLLGGSVIDLTAGTGEVWAFGQDSSFNWLMGRLAWTADAGLGMATLSIDPSSTTLLATDTLSMQPMNAGGPGLLFQEVGFQDFAQPNAGLVITSPDGGLMAVDDPLFAGANDGALYAPVHVSGADADDLVAASYDSNQGAWTLALYPATSSAGSRWAAAPSATTAVSVRSSFDGSDYPMVAGGIFGFASTPGGALDSVLVAGAFDDGSGGCDASNNGEAFAVYKVVGGQFQRVASTDTGLMDDPCYAQYALRLQAADFNGDHQNELLLLDRGTLQNYDYGTGSLSDLDLPLYRVDLTSSGDMGVTPLVLAGYNADAAAADFDGDGRGDLGICKLSFPLQSPDSADQLLFAFSHPDGSLY